MKHVITELFCFIVDDPNHGEEVPVSGGWMPLIAADAARLDSLRPFAADMAKFLGRPIRLVRFDNRTEMEVIKPE